MASHRSEELGHAAEVLLGAIRAAGLEPGAGGPGGVTDCDDHEFEELDFVEPARSSPNAQIFDVEEVERLAA
jgi:hypothetical protein